MYVKIEELSLIWLLKIINYVRAIKVDFKQSLAELYRAQDLVEDSHTASVTFGNQIIRGSVEMVCGTAAIHAGVSAAHLLVPGLNTGHSAVECVYELHAPKTQLEGGIGCICLGSSFTHKHSHPADLQQGNVLFRAVRQTQLGQDPNRGSHGCTSGFFGSSSDLWAGNYHSACVFARSQTNHVKVANRVENEVQKAML